VAKHMSRYPTWQRSLRELLMNCDAPDFGERSEGVRQTLLSRLRTMAAAELEERRAIEDALRALKILEATHEKSSEAARR